ncbi:hypothetical protein PLUTO_00850 [Luteibacter phage vB_LflM-Pluto]|uniref:Uncharacterized protein n=1 Tax=Luteibacter phage vB_LflM-Pluto TaxID=2948611 RepID=A0A9E7MVB1_9CAUD|nr:hypothetical protein PLUTO_00850 [Luteibacter phage vB_LflM-Pluto]
MRSDMRNLTDDEFVRELERNRDHFGEEVIVRVRGAFDAKEEAACEMHCCCMDGCEEYDHSEVEDERRRRLSSVGVDFYDANLANRIKRMRGSEFEAWLYRHLGGTQLGQAILYRERQGHR